MKVPVRNAVNVPDSDAGSVFPQSVMESHCELLQVIMLSSVTELHSYIDRTQLTRELGGTLEYCHEKWITHRTVRAV